MKKRPFTAPVRRGLALLMSHGEGELNADADSHTRKEWADVQAAFDWARDAGVFAEAAKQYERERGRGR